MAQRQKHIILGKRKGKFLSVEQIRLLDSIGFTTKEKSQLAWEEQYNEAKAFYEKEGHLLVPKNYRTDTGKQLSVWIKRQRSYYHQKKLTQEQIKMLNDICMDWTMQNYKKGVIKFSHNVYQSASAN